ncbi:AAA family ATPase [Xanthomonas campestris pv. campestris]|nr:AAA family ATPase [Xanthomonas campestris pv. campestris]
MKVIYRGRQVRRVNQEPDGSDDVLELLADNWDDFGFKTSFYTECRVKGRRLDLGLVRVLVSGTARTSAHLDALLKQGWSGEFPIPSTDYVSVPAEITFYEQLMGVLSESKTVSVARKLRDASYLTRVKEDDKAVNLTKSEGFKESLLRERGSQKSFSDVWKVLERRATAVLDFGFKFQDVFDEYSVLNLKYQAENPLPHEVNALIGPNGVGKSHVLHQIVEDWLKPSKSEELGFTEKPNLSQVVVVSYSPFEEFPVDVQGLQLQDKDAYRYYGFRGRTASDDSKSLGRVRLSRAVPKRDAAMALLDCLSDDKRYSTISDWAQKLKTMETVLRTAFEFDFAAVSVESNRRPKSFYHEPENVAVHSVVIGSGSRELQLIPIDSTRIEELDEAKLRSRMLPTDGVSFIRDNKLVRLSSGQKLFVYVVINILGAIRRNSLILIDEPELFLHPTLEIQFVDMLKRILSTFNSKALLATHSEVTVREIPAQCVHVFEKTQHGLVIKNPPFQTFGGDVQRISSYVFGDSNTSKPFERWVKERLKDEYADDLIASLGDQINEELLIQIRAIEAADQ